jgi:hypothetical protein
MLRFLTLTVTILLLGVAPDVVAQDYAVISEDTWIHQAPASRSARFRPGGDGWITVEKVGDDKAWTQIRFNHIDADRRCHGNLWALDEVTLDGWIRTRDLEHVTQRRVTSKFDDGTSIELNAGIVATPRKRKGWYTVHAGGYEWPARLKAAAVAKTFKPAPVFKHSPGVFKISPNDIVVGGEPIKGTGGTALRIRREVEIDGILRYELGWKCLTASVFADFKEPDGGVHDGLGLLGSLGATDRWVAPKGTAVYWSDKPVGSATRTFTIYKGREEGDRICFELGKQMKSGPLELCANKADLRYEKGGAPVKGLSGMLGGDKVSRSFAKLKASSKGISRAVTRRIMLQRMDQMLACREKAGTDRRAVGKLMAKFRVDEHGKVVHSEVASSTLHLSEVEACVLKVIDGLVFPAQKGRPEAEIDYPITFQN